MLKVLLLFVLLIAGIVVGPMIAGHQGYVLIQTDNYNIETSVTGLAIILILAMVVLFAIEWLLRRIFRTGAHTRGWFVGRKRRRARKQTEHRRSDGSISICTLSSSSGMTSTLANEVWRRLAASNGEILTCRCTPFSLRSIP